MSDSSEGKFLAVALGFTAATAIILALVLLGFAIIRDVEPGFLGDKESSPLAVVEIRGFNATLEAMGIAKALCVDGTLIRADEPNSLVYFILKFESKNLTSYIDSSKAAFYTGGKAHYPLSTGVTLHSGAQCVEIEDAAIATGRVKVNPGEEARLTFVFPITPKGKSGILEIPVIVGGVKYTFTVVIEKCKIAEASLSYAE